MSEYVLFETVAKSCPWSGNNNECLANMMYNGHVNDPKPGACSADSCGVWHFIDALGLDIVRK